MAPKPVFLYFDLGNVLLSFSHERGCEQMARVTGVSAGRIANFLFGDDERKGHLYQFEQGQLSEDEFYALYCQAMDTTPDRALLEHAAADIFDPIHESLSLLQQLHAGGHRLGLLSNTNSIHWRFVTDGRFPIFNEVFQQYVTSYEVKSMKPDGRVYQVAIERAGAAAEEIFFVDDRPENVAAAVAAGMDAVQYVGHAQLVADLAERGIAAG